MSVSHSLMDVLRTTPLLSIPAVRTRLGPVWLKLENLQRTGSFKVRGAAHKLSKLKATEMERGVIASSAGNHGLGLALCASRLGIPATIVVPEHTPVGKRRRIEAFGAQVVVEGKGYDEAEAMARLRASALGAYFISPFDDDDIIAGNGGSLADEILRQVHTHSLEKLVQVVCPVGGGGLIGGLAERLAPTGVRIVGVQPEANCAMHESRRQGKAVTRYQGKPTLAEGCEGSVCERTYALVDKYVDDIALVSESAIRRAVVFCYRHAGTIVECSGAVAVAAFLERVVKPAEGGMTVCILTGGNIEPDLLDGILATEETPTGGDTLKRL